MTALIVGASNSHCGGCGKPALPDEATHETVPSWSRVKEGCHRRFTEVRAETRYAPPELVDYRNLLERATRELRPDLPYGGEA